MSKTITEQNPNKKIIVKFPAIVGTEGYEPTGLQYRVLALYLQLLDSKEPLEPIQCLAQLGKSETCWYNWLKKPNFTRWWLKAVEEYHSRVGLAKIHSKLYKYAQRPANHPDRKTYLERFDKGYKPATAQDINFPGIAPPSDLSGAVERSRQRAEQHKAEQGQARQVKTVESKTIIDADQMQTESGPEPCTHEEKKDSNTDQPQSDPHPPGLER